MPVAIPDSLQFLHTFLSLRGRKISIVWRTLGSYSTQYSVATIRCPLRDCSLSRRILRVERTLARRSQNECYLRKWCHVALGRLSRVWIAAYLSKADLVPAACVSCSRTFAFSSKNNFKIDFSEWPQKENFKEAFKTMYIKCYKRSWGGSRGRESPKDYECRWRVLARAYFLF